MTKFDVLVIFSVDDHHREVIETVNADTPIEAKMIAEWLHDNTDEYDVEAIDVRLTPVCY